MLPDFPEAKARIHRVLMTPIRSAIREASLGAAQIRLHEGDRSTVQREDGTIVDLMPEEARVEIEMPRERLQGMSLTEVQQIYTDVADDMAGQVAGSYFRAVDEAVARADTAVDAKWSEFTFDLFLETLDKKWLQFDENGELVPPAIVMSPQMWDSIKDEVASWDKNPEYSVRYDRLIERKREEWREREARRKLVD